MLNSDLSRRRHLGCVLNEARLCGRFFPLCVGTLLHTTIFEVTFQRERERERECVCVCVRVCVRACVCVREREKLSRIRRLNKLISPMQ
jgi:hypothetical protein